MRILINFNEICDNKKRIEIETTQQIKRNEFEKRTCFASQEYLVNW